MYFPLILHGRSREEVFRRRGSYNSAINELPVATLLTLGSWQVSKRLWNIENNPQFHKLPDKFSLKPIILMPISYMISNISMLSIQDKSDGIFSKKSLNMSPDPDNE